VAQHRVGAEPGPDVLGVERRERPQAAQAEPPQQADQLGPVDVGLAVELLDAERREELRGVAGRHGEAPPGREHRGEEPVGHADLALDARAGGHLVDQHLRGRELTAEPPHRALRRQRHQPRPHDLHARRQLLHRDDHRFERAGVAIRVAVEHHQLGAPGLRLPATQPTSDAGGPCDGRAGEHPVRDDHRGGPLRGDVRGPGGGRDRPVR
jgi:hypothetical protein